MDASTPLRSEPDHELNLLTLNSGSSSLKFGLYRAGAHEVECLMSGEASAIGEPESTFQASDGAGAPLVLENVALAEPGDAMFRIDRLLETQGLPAPEAIGHRVVQGGPALRQHCRIDESVLRSLERASAFAPLHTPPALALIRHALARFPRLPQFACFDTSFHAGMPAVASTLPLPQPLRSEGIQRYGFHGLSCESIVRQLGGELPARLVIAHLGNGASVTAVRDGHSIDTSMGLTPTGGLIMGTRSGDLDPGTLIYLMREKGFDAAGLETLLDHRSGLRGISGLSGDMRALHEAARTQAEARLAIQMFCHAARKQVAAMSATLGGLDLLVFTGGIGENDAAVRAEICAGLGHIGVTQGRVRVLPSQEDAQIARHVRTLC